MTHQNLSLGKCWETFLQNRTRIELLFEITHSSLNSLNNFEVCKSHSSSYIVLSRMPFSYWLYTRLTICSVVESSMGTVIVLLLTKWWLFLWLFKSKSVKRPGLR